MYYYSNREFKDDEKHAETKLTSETLVKKVAAMKEFDPEDEKEEPPLEALIRTKYEIKQLYIDVVHLIYKDPDSTSDRWYVDRHFFKWGVETVTCPYLKTL